jgi:hypothetical protein
VLVRNSGRGKASGVDVKQIAPQTVNVFHIRCGKVVGFSPMPKSTAPWPTSAWRSRRRRGRTWRSCASGEAVRRTRPRATERLREQFAVDPEQALKAVGLAE